MVEEVVPAVVEYNQRIRSIIPENDAHAERALEAWNESYKEAG